ncbi:hypothetical protein FRC04_010806 [Tulasnella sp. 424]|nr:hypothetical protein FRC04_010806 [Tulasnella sp. 424]
MPRGKAALTYMKWLEQYGPLTWAVASGKSYLIVNDYETMKELTEKRGNIYIDRETTALLGELIAAIVRKTLAFLNSLLNRPQDFLLENKKMTAELITEISHGMIRDDEDGGHELVQMNLDVAKITATTVEGYWVDYLPWSDEAHPPCIPFAQWKRDAIKWRKQYSFAGDYMFGAVKKQLLDTRGEEDDYILDEHSNSVDKAGAETTESLIRTFLLAMTLHPSIQAIAQSEIDVVVGPDRFPSLDDKGFDKLPYLEATLTESLRWHPPVSPIIAHLPIRNDKFQGYFIPKGTAVFGNAWQVSRDHRLYQNPTEFNPERFLRRNENGGSPTLDPSALSPWEFGFGFGLRICPGRDLGFQAAWTTAVFVLWAFDIRTKDGITMEDGYKATDEDRFVPRSEKVEQMVREAAMKASGV